MALGVSDQCIRNWHAGGMKAADRDVRGFPLFEVEACRRWRSAFRPTTGQGGARPGQGRKPKAETVPPMFHVEHGSNGAVGSEQNEKLSARDLRRLVADPTGGSYSLLHGKAAKEQFLAVKAATEVANLRGELIDREEAIEAWGKQLGVFSRSLDGMPPRAAPRIVHAAAVIYAEGNLALGAGELSRRLQAAVLEILIDEARMVRGDIVGDPLNAGAAVGIAA